MFFKDFGIFFHLNFWKHYINLYPPMCKSANFLIPM